MPPRASSRRRSWARLCGTTCDVLIHPASLTQALERATGGAWLAQELQARQEHLYRAQRQFDGQVERLPAAYLGAVMSLAEYERRRRASEQQQRRLSRQGEQFAAQADRRAELAGMVRFVEASCRRIQASRTSATFEQRRQLVESLIERIVVEDGDAEIRYLIPTSPSTEAIRFCYMHSDYFDAPGVPDAAAEWAHCGVVERGERPHRGGNGRGYDGDAPPGEPLDHVGVAQATVRRALPTGGDRARRRRAATSPAAPDLGTLPVAPILPTESPHAGHRRSPPQPSARGPKIAHPSRTQGISRIPRSAPEAEGGDAAASRVQRAPTLALAPYPPRAGTIGLARRAPFPMASPPERA